MLCLVATRFAVVDTSPRFLFLLLLLRAGPNLLSSANTNEMLLPFVLLSCLLAVFGGVFAELALWRVLLSLAMLLDLTSSCFLPLEHPDCLFNLFPGHAFDDEVAASRVVVVARFVARPSNPNAGAAPAHLVNLLPKLAHRLGVCLVALQREANEQMLLKVHAELLSAASFTDGIVHPADDVGDYTPRIQSVTVLSGNRTLHDNHRILVTTFRTLVVGFIRPRSHDQAKRHAVECLKCLLHLAAKTATFRPPTRGAFAAVPVLAENEVDRLG